MPSILVTGTSSGIGLACVARFHASGWQVIATVRKAGDRDALLARFPGITVPVVDLVDGEAVTRVIGDTLAASNGVDVLVNNAGASIIGAAEELSIDDFRAQLELNLIAATRLTQIALPHMRAKGAGRIVQVSSGFGRIALPMFSAYCASKFALEGFSEALAHEVAPFGVQVSIVEPGAVRTHFDTNRREGAQYNTEGPYRALYAAMRARLARSHERGPSSPEDVAETVFTAATANNPALRYTVGRMGAAAALAARFTPDTLRLRAVARLLKH